MRRSLQRNQRRLGAAKLLFLALFLVVGGRAVQLQMLQGEKLMKLGQRQHLKEWIVLPKRGALFDRAGEPGIAIGLRASAPDSRCRAAKPRLGADSQLAGRRREAKDGQRKALYLAQTSGVVSGSGKNSNIERRRHRYVL